jgi:hypothetical protein
LSCCAERICWFWAAAAAARLSSAVFATLCAGCCGMGRATRSVMGLFMGISLQLEMPTKSRRLCLQLIFYEFGYINENIKYY